MNLKIENNDQRIVRIPFNIRGFHDLKFKYKKKVLLSMFLSFNLSAFMAQSQVVSNSYLEQYQKTNPSLHYSYENEKQTHNYSNNWDFDGDNINDEVYFIGNGGAHLYYFLRIVLSSDKIFRNFNFLQLDLPVLPTEVELLLRDYNPETSAANFAVFDDGQDKTSDLFVRLDEKTFQLCETILRKNGIKTRFVLVSIRNGAPIFRDFVPR